MTISLAATVTFIYTQTIHILNGVLKLNFDITGSVPYMVQEGIVVIM